MTYTASMPPGSGDIIVRLGYGWLKSYDVSAQGVETITNSIWVESICGLEATTSGGTMISTPAVSIEFRIPLGKLQQILEESANGWYLTTWDSRNPSPPGGE